MESFRRDIYSKDNLFLPDQELPAVIPTLSLTEEKESHTNHNWLDRSIRNTLLQGRMQSDVSTFASASNYYS